MAGIAIVYEIVAVILLSVVAISLLFLAWSVAADLFESARSNTMGILITIFTNPISVIAAAALFHSAARAGRPVFVFSAVVSALWLFVVALGFCAAYANVQFGKIFRDGSALFAFPEHQEAFANMGESVKSAVGFWALVLLLCSLPFLLSALDTTGNVSGVPAGSSFSDYLAFTFQRAIESEPTGVVKAASFKLSQIDDSQANAMGKVIIWLFHLGFGTIVSTSTVSAIAKAMGKLS